MYTQKSTRTLSWILISIFTVISALFVIGAFIYTKDTITFAATLFGAGMLFGAALSIYAIEKEEGSRGK